MRPLWEFANFVRAVRARLRFGELSRAPLRLLRLQLQGEMVECDWMARPPDTWDADLPRRVGDHNASLQALEDAIAVRDLLFTVLPGAQSAAFRVFRQTGREPPRLIISGTVSRDAEGQEVSSLAMRAKLSGLRFCLEDGVLKAASPEEFAISDR